MRKAKNIGKKRGPAPRGPFEEKRRTLTTRITDATRRRLEDAANRAGRSLSQEIEFRLDQSLRGDDTWGGPELHALFRMLSGAASLIERRTGKGNLADWETNL